MSSHILWPQNFMIENKFSSEGFLASSLLATLTLDDGTIIYLLLKYILSDEFSTTLGQPGVQTRAATLELS